MIPKNNFKSLHIKYYCLKFMIFKLQVKRVLCCVVVILKHTVKTVKKQGHCSSRRDHDPVSEDCPSTP